MVLLLLACTAEPAASPDSAEAVDTGQADPCAYDAPEEVDLEAWGTIGESGSSAQLAFDFALGPLTQALSWDDGATDSITLTASPERIWETLYGPPESCLVSLSTSGTYAVDADDFRLTASVPFLWTVEDARSLDPATIGSVTFDSVVAGSSVTVSPLGTDSTFAVRGVLRTSGDVAAELTEAWALDEHITRTCRRASTSDPLDCSDVDDRDNQGD